jgi:hypothetical protein
MIPTELFYLYLQHCQQQKQFAVHSSAFIAMDFSQNIFLPALKASAICSQ